MDRIAYYSQLLSEVPCVRDVRRSDQSDDDLVVLLDPDVSIYLWGPAPGDGCRLLLNHYVFEHIPDNELAALIGALCSGDYQQAQISRRRTEIVIADRWAAQSGRWATAVDLSSFP